MHIHFGVARVMEEVCRYFLVSIVRCLQALTWFVCVERREERRRDHEKGCACSLKAMCPHIYACKLSAYNPIIPHAGQPWKLTITWKHKMQHWVDISLCSLGCIEIEVAGASYSILCVAHMIICRVSDGYKPYSFPSVSNKHNKPSGSCRERGSN